MKRHQGVVVIDKVGRPKKVNTEPRREDPPPRTAAATAVKPQNRKDAARKMRAMFKG